MFVSPCGGRWKYAGRPNPCLSCGAPAVWNGWRPLKSGEARHRACCSSKDCSSAGWTVYAEDAYPHRGFGLALVVSAVSAVVFGGARLSAAGLEYGCSRRSIARWWDWIAGLADTNELARACARLDSDGFAHAEPLPTRESAPAHVLRLLDRLADLLVVRGLDLATSGPGLVRLLSDQLRRFGEVFYLTRPSPPLRFGLSRLGA
jgi:hypothetical protein